MSINLITGNRVRLNVYTTVSLKPVKLKIAVLEIFHGFFMECNFNFYISAYLFILILYVV